MWLQLICCMLTRSDQISIILQSRKGVGGVTGVCNGIRHKDKLKTDCRRFSMRVGGLRRKSKGNVT